MRQFAFIMILVLVSIVGFAQSEQTPIGRWKTIDDASGEARAIVEIREDKGVLSGQIVKTFPKPGDAPNCTKCEGELKDRPIEGFPLLSGVKADGDVWDGGQIIDPKNGKTYSVKLSMIEEGRKMKVRGFIGFSLLGRTQVWIREVPEAVPTPDSGTH